MSAFEGLLIDNDLLGNAQRLLRGIEVNDETLSYDVIRDTVSGIGHYRSGSTRPTCGRVPAAGR